MVGVQARECNSFKCGRDVVGPEILEVHALAVDKVGRSGQDSRQRPERQGDRHLRTTHKPYPSHPRKPGGILNILVND